MAQHDRIERGTGCGPQPEADVGDAEGGEHAGQRLDDQAYALDRLEGGVDEFLVAGRQREGERVEDQRARRYAVFADDDVVDAPGDLELAPGGLRHSVFVDRERDDGRAALFY